MRFDVICIVGFGLSVLVLACFPVNGFAETRYVSDLLIITLREDTSGQGKVLRTLRSDTPVEVLAEAGEYIKVRAPDGIVGWIKKRYTTLETPKPVIIDRLEKQIARLTADLDAVRKEKTMLSEKAGQALAAKEKRVEALEPVVEEKDETIQRLRNELAALEKKYAALMGNAKNVSALMEEAKAAQQNAQYLRKENERLRALRQTFEKETRHLKKNIMVRWFVAGAATLLVGMLLGKISRKKDYYR